MKWGVATDGLNESELGTNSLAFMLNWVLGLTVHMLVESCNLFILWNYNALKVIFDFAFKFLKFEEKGKLFENNYKAF